MSEVAAEDHLLVKLHVTGDMGSNDITLPHREITLSRALPSAFIGRSSNNVTKQLPCEKDNGLFDSPVMSRAHARLSADFENQEVHLTDMGSTHGTYINALPAPAFKPQLLRNNDSVVLGIAVYRDHKTHRPATLRAQFAWPVEHTISSRTNQTNVFRAPVDYDTSSDIEALNEAASSPERFSRPANIEDIEAPNEVAKSPERLLEVVDLTSDRSLSVPTSETREYVDSDEVVYDLTSDSSVEVLSDEEDDAGDDDADQAVLDDVSSLCDESEHSGPELEPRGAVHAPTHIDPRRTSRNTDFDAEARTYEKARLAKLEAVPVTKPRPAQYAAQRGLQLSNFYAQTCIDTPQPYMGHFDSPVIPEPYDCGPFSLSYSLPTQAYADNRQQPLQSLGNPGASLWPTQYMSPSGTLGAKPVKPLTPLPKSRKRSAAELSEASFAEKVADTPCTLLNEKHPAARGSSTPPQVPRVEPSVARPSPSPPTKKAKTMVSQMLSATIGGLVGGATVGAVVISALAYTAPSFV